MKITEAVLKVCKVEVTPSIMNPHMDVLTHHLDRYPHEHTEMKTFIVMPGLYTFGVDDVFQGVIPNKVVFGLVMEHSFNEDVTKNQFNFIHGQINEVGVLVKDNPVPLKPYCPKFAQHINSVAR